MPSLAGEVPLRRRAHGQIEKPSSTAVACWRWPAGSVCPFYRCIGWPGRATGFPPATPPSPLPTPCLPAYDLTGLRHPRYVRVASLPDILAEGASATLLWCSIEDWPPPAPQRRRLEHLQKAHRHLLESARPAVASGTGHLAAFPFQCCKLAPAALPLESHSHSPVFAILW